MSNITYAPRVIDLAKAEVTKAEEQVVAAQENLKEAKAFLAWVRKTMNERLFPAEPPPGTPTPVETGFAGFVRDGEKMP